MGLPPYIFFRVLRERRVALPSNDEPSPGPGRGSTRVSFSPSPLVGEGAGG
ncbi:MAG TPA: hypothetical protein VHG28_03595 [Longimicrobiaceae bacterium]|nr:hypothetical protein [Longimicrobiaceae bacterium]